MLGNKQKWKRRTCLPVIRGRSQGRQKASRLEQDGRSLVVLGEFLVQYTKWQRLVATLAAAAPVVVVRATILPARLCGRRSAPRVASTISSCWAPHSRCTGAPSAGRGAWTRTKPSKLFLHTTPIHPLDRTRRSEQQPSPRYSEMQTLRSRCESQVRWDRPSAYRDRLT